MVASVKEYSDSDVVVDSYPDSEVQIDIPEDTSAMDGIKTLAKNVAMGGAAGVPMGATQEDALPIAFGALSGAAGGVPRAMLENPKELVQGGVVGAQFAQGANQSMGVLGAKDPFLADFLKRNFNVGDERMYGKEVSWITPKTASGAVAQTLLETLTPGVEAIGLGGKPRNLIDELQRLRKTQTKLVDEFLQPERSRLSQYSKRGTVTPETRAGAEIIKKSKEAQEVVGQFQAAKHDNISAVSALIAENNKPVKNQYLGKAKVFYEKAKSEGIYDARTLSNMEKRIKQEEAYLAGLDSEFDTISAQKRKILLEQQTANLLKAKSKGQNIATKPGVDLIEDQLRMGLKESVEQAHPEIKTLNSQYGGIIKGEELASLLAADERVIPKGLLGKLAWVVGRPSIPSAAAALIRELPLIGKTTASRTGKIESLGNQMDILADAIARSKAKQVEAKLVGTEARKLLGFEETGLVKSERDLSRGFSSKQPKEYQPQLEGTVSRKGLEGRTIGENKQLPAPESVERLTPREAELRRIQNKKGKYSGGKGKIVNKSRSAVNEAISRLINRVR